MSLEEQIASLTEALAKNTTVLERVVAFQEHAVSKIEESTAPKATRARRSTTAAPEEPVAGKQQEPAAGPAETSSTEASPADSPSSAPAADVPTMTDDEFRQKGNALIKAMPDQAAASAIIKEFLLGSLCQHFGVEQVFGPKGIQDPADRYRAWFFLQRKVAKLPVDFNADYDFNGPIDQGAPLAGDSDPLADLG